MRVLPILVMLVGLSSPIFAGGVNPFFADIDSSEEIALAEASAASRCVPAAENAYLQLCHRFNSEAGAAQCIAAGRDRYFEQCSLAICNRFTTENGALSCIEATRDKSYTDDEIALCNRFSSESGAVSCLQSSGRHYRGGEEGGVRMLRVIRRDVANALIDLESGRSWRATDRLQEVIDRIDRALGE